MTVKAERLLDRPIIHHGMDESLGDNINGPSLIRAPSWAPHPLGRYYLYFAHHEGRSIRLAYADDLRGPWSIHRPGALSIENSMFPSDPSQITPGGRTDDDVADMGIIDYIPHIASPDVLVNEDNRHVILYFHGMVEDGNQKTRLAVSGDGINFDSQPALFDHFYFRAFFYADKVWVISWGGYLYRADTIRGPFERGPSILETAPVCLPSRILRHLALTRDGDRLHLFFSRIGDEPEVILHCEIALSPDWNQWSVGKPREILRPRAPWEGADLPILPSRAGAAHAPEHALRDPCVFHDTDGRTYLLYSGAGEQAIGLAELIGI